MAKTDHFTQRPSLIVLAQARAGLRTVNGYCVLAPRVHASA
jgi:hypothetical protein